jgi:hypothetical protein
MSMGILLRTMTENMEAAIGAPLEGAHAGPGAGSAEKPQLPLIYLFRWVIGTANIVRYLLLELPWCCADVSHITR